MGRMLEILKTRDESRSLLLDTKEPPKVSREVVVDWSMREEEVPFIEFGPNRSMDGSARVLAAPAPTAPTPRVEPAQQPPVSPPHPPTEQALAKTVLSAQLLEPKPLNVRFEPFAGLYEIGKIAADIITYHQPNHPISQQYVALASQLLQNDGVKVLLFSGVRPSVGTSTVLLNLAVAATQQAQKSVAIIDAQRNRPGLADKLGVKPFAFLQDVLAGTVAIEQALIKSPLPRLALLAATASHPEIALGVEALTWILSNLKDRNDLVLIDGASLDEQTDLSLFAPLADAMYLVTPQDEPASLGRGLAQTVSRLGGRLRGLLHTRIG